VSTSNERPFLRKIADVVDVVVVFLRYSVKSKS
jgi:hypothetical protein